MSEPDPSTPSDSSSSAATAAASANKGTRIVRSRFPRAQPNIALSSGIARIRRLSGHFTDQGGDQPPPVPSTPPPSQSIASLVAAASPTVAGSPLPQPLQQHLVESVLLSPRAPTPGLAAESAPSPSIFSDAAVRSPYSRQPSTFRQFVLSGGGSGAPSPAPPSSVQSLYAYQQPATPGSVAPAYKPKFSKEHVMNIIKYKAMQKLKKNESENLRERRKKYKKNSAILSLKPTTQPSTDQNEQPPVNGSENVEQPQQQQPQQQQQQSQTNLTEKQQQPIDRSKLRMRDFLYYNPRINKKQQQQESEKGEKASSPSSSSTTSAAAAKKTNRSASSASLATSEADTNDSMNSHATSIAAAATARAPPQQPQIAAPQLKIAEDGTIVINEESLVIQREAIEPVYDSTIVEESELNEKLTYNSYRKFHHSKKWTSIETAKFYKALGMVGTDFTMIQKFFAHRSRNEIKRKFKREEKLNQALIDKILTKTVQIDFSAFVSGSEEETANGDNNEADGTTKTKGAKKSAAKKSDRSNSSESKESATQKRKKLRRINITYIYSIIQGEFVGSESEGEEKKENEKSSIKTRRSSGESNKKYKSRQYIIDSSDEESSEQQKKDTDVDKTDKTPQPSIPNPQEKSTSPVKTPVAEESAPNSKPPQTDDDNSSSSRTTGDNKSDEEDEEEAEGVELVLDLDTNQVIKVVKTDTAENNSATSNQNEQNDDDDDDDDGDDMVIDLDASTLVCNNVLVSTSDTNNDESRSKSSITITKRDPNKTE